MTSLSEITIIFFLTPQKKKKKTQCIENYTDVLAQKYFNKQTQLATKKIDMNKIYILNKTYYVRQSQM